MVGFGEAILDAVTATDPVERMAAEQGGGALAVLGQVGKLDAIIGEHGMDPVRDRLDQGIKKSRSGRHVGALDEAGKGELGSADDGNEKIELALGGAQLGEIDVEVTDGILFELLLFGGRCTVDLGQAADAVALEAAVQSL